MKQSLEAREIRRIIKKRGVLPSKTVKRNSEIAAKFEQEQENSTLLNRCYNYWCSLSNLRDERARNVRYKNGDQWSDTIEDPDRPGFFLKEKSVITRDGKLPLKHNIIGQIVRNLVGQMLTYPSQSEVFARNENDQNLSEMLTSALNRCLVNNSSRKLDISAMEELILSGLCCMKVRYGTMPGHNECDGRIESVNVNRLFFNNDIEDPRLLDITLIGQLHEYSFEEIVTSFASSAEDELKLRSIFSGGEQTLFAHQIGETNSNSVGFYSSSDSSKYRIIEVWQQEWHWVGYAHDMLDGSEEPTTLTPKKINEINRERILSAKNEGGDGSEVPLIEYLERYESFWSVKFISPNGHTLHSATTPYRHQSHPYVISTMPMIDGEFKSYISDIIDIQRYINRLIVTIDSVMGSSAKGVLMVPEDCIPDGYSVEDFAHEYVKSNGIIVYRPSNRGNIPQQITSSSSPAGIWDMLRTQMQIIEQVSGVSEAIQGQDSSPYTSASLYSQKANNSQLNYRVLFDTLNSFIKDRDEKLLKILMQYYTEQRVIDISTTSSKAGSARYWEPDLSDKITNFNLVVTQSFDTPTYRMQFEQRLLDMLKDRYIDFELYLKNSTLPFASKLLSQIETPQQNQEQN